MAESADITKQHAHFALLAAQHDRAAEQLVGHILVGNQGEHIAVFVLQGQPVPANERTEPEYLDLLQLGQEVA